MNRILLTAPTSGAGKTTITLGILRALSRRGVDVQPAKSGPDYIDPAFHAVAAQQSSLTLDAWAMPPDRLKTLTQDRAPLLVEGAMGFFDGAGLKGVGSAADLARILDLGFVLILDCAKAAHTVRAIARGIIDEAKDLSCVGLILNRVGSDRHLDILKSALSPIDVPILGHLPRDAKLALPERHLGLVQAREHPDLEVWLNHLANLIEKHIDLSVFTNGSHAPMAKQLASAPPAQSIAVAQDDAFAFAYPQMLLEWQNAGASVKTFSPLANDPVPDTDFVFLPGGYPELHAGRISSNHTFLQSLKEHSLSKPVYGECGGYMVMGDGMVDSEGRRHQMAGLLRLETSFEKRKLHLGYRKLTPLGGHITAPVPAHEFHYASTLKAEGPTLFAALDADGAKLDDMGLQLGCAYGSFAHIIDGL